MFAAVLTSIAELPQIGPVLLPYVHFGRLAQVSELVVNVGVIS
jgi:hypothetical protein